MMHLPEGAAAQVARIEALLAQAEEALARGGATDEATFALREMKARYVPDTLRAYLDVPPGLRGEADATGRTPDDRLTAQLDHLERATAQRLRELGARSTDTVAANERFLTERFGPPESLPPADIAVPGPAAPATLVRTLFEQIARDAGPAPAALVAVASERFGTIVPQLLSLRRGMLGMGPVEAFSLEVPVRDGALRYSLTATRSGIEATAAKVVRGVALRTQTFELDEWLHGLYEDLGAYIDRDRRTRDALTRFLER